VVTQGRLWINVAFPINRAAARQLESTGLQRSDGHEIRELPSAVRCRARPAPHNLAAGLELCTDDAYERYREDSFCYPPFHYMLCSCLDKDNPRPPSSTEKEWLFGFPSNHTFWCRTKARRKASAASHEQKRNSLLGTSMSPLIVAYLIADWADAVGLRATRPLMSDIIARCGALVRPGEFECQTKRGSGGGSAEVQLLTAEFFRHATHRGTEMRLGRSLSGRPDRWPLCAFPSGALKWHVEMSFPLDHAHINVQELRAVLAALKWRSKKVSEHRCRFAHLVDSQVSLLALAKGRSSSSRLTFVIQRIAALCLAAWLVPIFGYVETSDNPADMPSRWW
jgi:hypothetical protein